ncbi:MAG: hypothetical protein RL095_988 [Verrucomicrobiota bacterium]|jgi:flagellar hook-associated protein 3 FlgL
MNRVSTGAQYDDLASRVLETQSRYSQKQMQISSGRAWISRSEAPADASESALIERSNEETKQFADNVSEAGSWLAATQARTQDSVDTLQKALELITQSNNGAIPATARKDIGEQLDALIEQLYQTGNSQYAGTYLFSGTDAQEPLAATRDPASGLITAVTSNADASTERRQTQIDHGSVVPYGDLAAGTSGTFIATDKGVDLFANLIKLRDVLRTGQQVDVLDQKQLENNLDHVINRISSNGVRQQWFEQQNNTLISVQETNLKQVGLLKDADMSKSIMELSQLQTSFQASMQMIAKNNEMSILKYI